MYNKKKQKAKFKFRLEFLGILVAVVLMITLSIVLRLPDASTKFSNKYTEAGASLTSDHVYNEMKFDELLNHIKSEKLVFVFVGSTDSEESVSQISTINSNAAAWDVEEVIYLDATFSLEEFEEEDTKEESELKSKISDMENQLKALTKDSEVENYATFDYVPALWAFENGKLVFNSNDYLDDDQEGLKEGLDWTKVATDAFYRNLPKREEN